jgi:hypothetical protein
MNKKRVFKKIVILLIIVASLAVVFFAGMEYKAYQIRKAMSQVFNVDTMTNTINENDAEARKDYKYIEKSIGDEIQVATIKFKIKETSEAQIYNIAFGDPLVAKEGAKFVIVNIDVTNTTKETFYNSTDFGFLIDDKERIFSSNKEFLGTDKGIAGDITPDIKKNGDVLFEIPSDAVNYSFNLGKAGTKDVYRIKLK